MKHTTGNPLPDCHKPALPQGLSALWHKAALKEKAKKAERALSLLPREEKIKRRCPEKNFHGDKEHAKSRHEERMEYERQVTVSTVCVHSQDVIHAFAKHTCCFWLVEGAQR